jgi:hypothetical protein
MHTTVEPLSPAVATRPTSKAADVALYSALALAFLVLYAMIERRLAALGALAVNDALFDADPGTRLRGIAHGWERLLVIHPLFPYVFTAPIRIVAKGWTFVAGAGAGGESGLRETLALAVSPLCGAAAVVAMSRATLAAGVPRAGAAICAVGFGLSFSTLVFASIPDHFILSNLLAAGCLLLCSWSASAGRPGVLWWPLGVAATGVTITNLAIPVCGYFVVQYQAARDFWRSARATVTYAAVVLAVTAVVAVAGAAASGQLDRLLPQEMGGRGSESMLLRYIASNPLARVARAPKAVADSLAPAALTLAPPANPEKSETAVPHLSLETGATLLGAPLLVLLVLAAAIASHRSADRGFSAPVLAALMILGGNVAAHALFGKEYFLYSQHWMAAMWLVIAGLWRSRYWREPFGSAAALAAIAWMAYVNYGIWLDAFRVLEAGLTPGAR